MLVRRRQALGQLAGRGLGILCVGDRPQHAHAAGAGGEHLVDVAGVQPADREEGHMRVLGGVAHELGAHRRAPRLRWRLVHRSDTDVVDERGICRIDLRGCVRREPDDRGVSHDLAHLRRGQVVLSDVHAVGPHLGSDPRAVVDDEENVEAAAERLRGMGDSGQLVVCQELLAQLHDVDAARRRRAHEVGEAATRRRRSEHEVEPRAAQARAPLGTDLGDRHCLESRTRARSPGAGRRASINRMSGEERAELAVVGGGIVGLVVAWRARQAGLDVLLLEREDAGRGAAHVAAGMLAPVSEVEFGPAGRRLLDLGLRSAALWPDFAAELGEVSGVEVGLRRTGTMLLARDDDEARELERQLEFRRSLDLQVRRLRASEARELEPALAPTVRLALEVPDDHSLDPRRVLAALRLACESAGVRLRERAAVGRVLLDPGALRVSGVELEGGERVAAERIVLAAGARSGGLEGLAGPDRLPVRPVKGQILRLRDHDGPGLVQRVLRFEGGYLVPRGDGRYVLGATVEEQGFELGATAGGVYELLRDARELVPGVAELELEEVAVGLRPGTPDNLPIVGAGAAAGLIWATGHHRNGVLLAPLTGELVGRVLEGDTTDEALAACSPARFAAPGLRMPADRSPAGAAL